MANNQQQTRPRQIFIYTASFLPLAVSAADIRRVQISAEAEFLLEQITFDVRVNDDTESSLPDPAITVQLKHNQKDLSDGPVRLSSIAGTAKEPYILTVPLLLSRNSVLEVAATQGAVGAPRVVRIHFHGQKIY